MYKVINVYRYKDKMIYIVLIQILPKNHGDVVRILTGPQDSCLLVCILCNPWECKYDQFCPCDKVILYDRVDFKKERLSSVGQTSSGEFSEVTGLFRTKKIQSIERTPRRSHVATGSPWEQPLTDSQHENEDLSPAATWNTLLTWPSQQLEGV